MTRTHTALPLYDLGPDYSYAEAWALQKRLQEQQIAGKRGPLVLFVEHPPTITIGRRGNAGDVVAPLGVLQRRGVEVVETDRGGQVTYHGPGQLVVYPLIHLESLKLGLHEYMRALEEAAILVLADFGIEGSRVRDYTGVWVGKEKLCAIGIRVRRWWTIHGLALNLSPDLNHFGLIIPCGIRDRGVTSLAKLLGENCPTMTQVKDAMRRSLGTALNFDLTQAPLNDLHDNENPW